MPNRYVCDVLEEMRKMYETRNFAGFLGLVEEVQTMVNRMEASLQEKRDLASWHEKAKEERDEYRRLLNMTNALRRKVGEKEKKESRY